MKRNWKVVYHVERDGRLERYVFGCREAKRAWSLFWLAKKQAHLLRPELWWGRKRVL